MDRSAAEDEPAHRSRSNGPGRVGRCRLQPFDSFQFGDAHLPDDNHDLDDGADRRRGAASSQASVTIPSTTIVLEAGVDLLVRDDGGGMDAETDGYLRLDPASHCMYLTLDDTVDSPRYLLIWPPGTTVTLAPLQVTEPLGTVKSQGSPLSLRGGESPLFAPYPDNVSEAVRRCITQPTDRIWTVADDRL